LLNGCGRADSAHRFSCLCTLLLHANVRRRIWRLNPSLQFWLPSAYEDEQVSAFFDLDFYRKTGNRSSGAKQAAEKGLIADERPEEHTAGAEANVDSMTVTARLKSCPDTRLRLTILICPDGASGCAAALFLFCLMTRVPLTFFGFAEFGDYGEVFEGGGVAFDFAVGG
jgi:hypothetical protein